MIKLGLATLLCYLLHASRLVPQCAAQRFGGHGNGNRFGHRPTGPFHNNGWRGHSQSFHPVFQPNPNVFDKPTTAGCLLPSFDSNDVEFYLEACDQPNRNDHTVCSGFGRVPVDWVGTMTCQSDILKVKFSSTCTLREEWNPQFPRGCAELIYKYVNGVKEEPIGHHESGERLTEQESYPQSYPQNRPRESPCAKLKVEVDTRFVFYCRFPGGADDVENCGSERMVESGTVAYIGCRPPWRSRDGKPNSWRCEDGRWKGLSNQMACYRDSYDPTEGPAVDQTGSPYSPVANKPELHGAVGGLEGGSLDVTLPTPHTPPQYSTYEQLPAPPKYTRPSIPSTTSPPPQQWQEYKAPEVRPVFPVNEPPRPIAVENSVTTAPPIKATTSIPPRKTSAPKVTSRPVTTAPSPSKFQPDQIQFTDPPDIDIRELSAQKTSDGYPYRSPTKPTLPASAGASLPAAETTKSPVPIGATNTSVKCPGLRKKPGIKLECTFRDGYVSISNCSEPMPVDSEAKYSCEEHYETFGLPTQFRKCKQDGTWTGSSGQFSCVLQCGVSATPRVPYITFGTPSTRGQWPWHAALFLKTTATRSETWQYVCGGTLIGNRAVLTAAHCVTHLETTTVRSQAEMRVDLGKYLREQVDEHVQIRDIYTIVVHPSYSPYGYDSDIAVIILKEPAKIGFHVRPVCFPQTADSRVEELHLSEGSTGTVVGWGYDENRKLADALQVTNLPVASSQDCLEAMQAASAFQLQTRSTTFCAGFKNRTNVCGGDSGGGMVFPYKNSDSTRWYLEGVVSVGIPDKNGNCDPTKYAVFTRVGRYADWIVRQLWEHDAV